MSGPPPPSNVVSLRGDNPRLAGAPRPWQPYYPSAMLDRPDPPDWAVDGIAMQGVTCLMVGKPGIGKSLLLQQLLVAVALGQPWLGYGTKQARAFGLFTEDPLIFLQQRHWTICEHYEVMPGDLEDRLAWDAAAVDIDNALWIVDRDGEGRPTYFFETLWERLTEGGFSFLVIDTAAVVFRGNENIRDQVTAFMRALSAEAWRRQITVVLAAHPNKAGGTSGSTAWEASCRFAVAIDRPANSWSGDGGVDRTLVGIKANYAAGTRRNFFYDRGIFREAQTGPATPARSHWDAIALQERVLDGMRRVMENGGAMPADEAAGGSLPRRARASPELCRVPLNDIYAAQAALLRAGRVVRVMVRGRCLVRPAEGRKYEGEKPWVTL